MVKVLLFWFALCSSALCSDIPLINCTTTDGDVLTIAAKVKGDYIQSFKIIVVNTFTEKLLLQRVFLVADENFHYEIKDFRTFDGVTHSFFEAEIPKPIFSYILSSKTLIFYIKGNKFEMDKESMAKLHILGKEILPVINLNSKA